MNLQSNNIKDVITEYVSNLGYTMNKNDFDDVVNNIYTLTKTENPISWHSLFTHVNNKHIIYSFFKQYEKNIPLFHFITVDVSNNTVLSLIDNVYDTDGFYKKMNDKYFGDILNDSIAELFDISFINYLTKINIKDVLLCKYTICNPVMDITMFLFEQYTLEFRYYKNTNSVILLKDDKNIFSMSNITDIIRGYKLTIISYTSFNTSEKFSEYPLYKHSEFL